MSDPEAGSEETNPLFKPEYRIDATYEQVIAALKATGKILFFDMKDPFPGAIKATKIQDDIEVGLEIGGHIVESEQTNLVYFVPLNCYEVTADRLMNLLREIL